MFSPEIDQTRLNNASASTSSLPETWAGTPHADRLRNRQRRGVPNPNGGPCQGPPPRSRVANFSDRVWGVFGDPYQSARIVHRRLSGTALVLMLVEACGCVVAVGL